MCSLNTYDLVLDQIFSNAYSSLQNQKEKNAEGSLFWFA